MASTFKIPPSDRASVLFQSATNTQSWNPLPKWRKGFPDLEDVGQFADIQPQIWKQHRNKKVTKERSRDSKHDLKLESVDGAELEDHKANKNVWEGIQMSKMQPRHQMEREEEEGSIPKQPDRFSHELFSHKLIGENFFFSKLVH